MNESTINITCTCVAIEYGKAIWFEEIDVRMMREDSWQFLIVLSFPTFVFSDKSGTRIVLL